MTTGAPTLVPTSKPTSLFTGILNFTEEFVDNNPTYFVWSEEGGGSHWRNAAIYFESNFSDPRLNGDYLAVINFDRDKRITETNWTWGKYTGIWLVLTGEGDVLWEGVSTQQVDEKGNGQADITLHGVGLYKGLTATMSCEYQYVAEPHDLSEIKCQGRINKED